ncbi:hypothetical protein MTR_3g094960 [Medicago truncatula]|uniref:Uncharacterized protein n=1 Tax=Medicago truncatula TaxID=3880 RepID=G7JAA9_MEDTR|nr:hypothetical protein MTR_3g094960 [Medicago truncatula]
MDILKLDVSNHEIHVVVKHMGAFKAPERIAFKQFSTKVGESILDNFWDPYRIKSLHETLITLIPKVDPKRIIIIKQDFSLQIE